MSSDPSQTDQDLSAIDTQSDGIPKSLATSPESVASKPQDSSGPLNLERIRSMRQSLEQSQSNNNRDQKQNRNKPQETQTKEAGDHDANIAASVKGNAGTVASQADSDANSSSSASDKKQRDHKKSKRERENQTAAPQQFLKPRIAVPNTRTPLSPEQNNEFDAALADADLDALMIGDKSLQVGRRLETGQRYQAKIIKVHNDNVFVSMGGPNEGIVPLLQFTDMPQIGQSVDCIIRNFDENEGLYLLAMPGESITVEDWSDLENGAIVEAKIESANTGGLECKVGMIRGFIPMSQISEFRIEDASSYIGQTLPCVITEVNSRRGNLVLSHRAILERERQAKRAERLAALQVGDSVDGTVRKVTDFGAFVDIGGLDGLIHISQLSWEKIKHPSEVVKEGDKVKVRIEKVDLESGRIGLSYRSMQDHPWQDIECRFPVGIVVKGAVTRIAAFGVFVRIAPGIEGLVHVSEIAHRRISSPASVVQEEQEVDVKVLSVDREAQRISLSMKQAIAAPMDETVEGEKEDTTETARKTNIAKHRGPLKGGIGSGSGGEQFGLKW